MLLLSEIANLFERFFEYGNGLSDKISLSISSNAIKNEPVNLFIEPYGRFR
jgi:hypothetical protein